MAEERIESSAKERQLLKVLHEVEHEHLCRPLVRTRFRI